MEEPVDDFSLVPEDWLPVAYAEYGRWYEYEDAPYTIKQCRFLEANDIITMTQKRIFNVDSNGYKVPSPRIELLIRRRRLNAPVGYGG